MTGSVELTTPLSFLETSVLEPGETIWSHFDRVAPKDRPVICMFNGAPLLRKDWDTIVCEDDEIQFVVMPQGGNNTFTKILRTIAVLALAIAAPIVAPIIGGALGITSAIGISLISAGLVIAGSFLINALLPAQTAQGSQQTISASPTYSLTAQGNSARLLEPIPRLYGRHQIFPDFASLPWATYRGNDQYLYQLFCLGVGRYDVEQINIEDTKLWDKVNGYSGSFSDIQFEIIQPGSQVTLFPSAVITSVEVGGQDLADTNWVGPYVANPADRATNRLEFDIIFPRGVYYANDAGGLSGYSLGVEIQVQKINALGNPIGSWVTLQVYTISAATATPQRVTLGYDVSLTRYQARIRRTGPKESNTRYASDISWGSLRAFIPDDNVFADVTLMAVVMRATNQLTDQSSRRFNVIQTAMIPTWNGSSWTGPVATRSIAWAAADMLRNDVYGAGLPDSRIDINSLNQLNTIWADRGDKFDGVFDTKQSLWAALAQVLQAGRAQPLLIGGQVSFTRDQPATITRGVLTPRNIVRGSFETTHILYDENSPDAVIIEFIDERTWKRNEVLCKIPGSTEDNPARIQIFGIVQRLQAYREGMYMAAVNLYRRIFAAATTELEGRLLIRGDAVAVAHDLVKWGSSAEIVEWNSATRTIGLSDPISSDAEVIGMADRRGRLWGPVAIAAVQTSGFEVVLDASDLAAVQSAQGAIPIYLGDDQEPTRAMAGTLENWSKKFKLVSAKPDRTGAVQLTLTNDDPRVYTAELATPPDEVSPYGPGTVPEAPKMTGLYVSQDPSSGANPVLLRAGWNAAAGATSYLIEASSDGINYATVYEGGLTFCTFSMEAGPVYVRGSARGTFKGPLTFPSPNPVTYGTPSLVPSQPQNLNVSASTSAGVVNVTWTPANRASSYRVEVYSIGSGSYDQLEMTRTVSTTSLLFTSTDVGAAGGPWDSIKTVVTPINSYGEGPSANTTTSGITMDPPATVYLVTPYNGTEINAQWSAVVSAAAYVAEIWQAGIMRAQYGVTNANLLVTQDALGDMGGPWRSLELRVKAVNGSLVSSATVLTITDAAPAVPANIATSSDAPGEVTISWDAVSDSNLTAYVLYADDVNGFTPAPANEVYRGPALGVNITGLPSGDTIYFRLRAIDSYAGGDGYNTSAQFSQLVD